MANQIRVKEVFVAQKDPILGGWADGYPHTSDPQTGYCNSCDCAPGQYHYRLIGKWRDNPIYDRLMRGIAYGYCRSYREIDNRGCIFPYDHMGRHDYSRVR